MIIPENDWVEYINKLSQISKKAADLMQAYIDKHGTDNRDDLINYAYALATKYGEAAASQTGMMYDKIADTQNAHVKTAENAPTATWKEVKNAIFGTMKNKDNTVAQTVGRLVKTAGADTALFNAERDGAEFAWVPHGDTCGFCISLAAKGWQKMSKAALKNGHAEHIHANCDCEYCVRFDKNTTVEGYDPEKYREMYENAEGETSKEKINSMRREAEAKERQEKQNFDELVSLHTRYGTPDDLLVFGSDQEISRYGELLRASGLTQAQIRDKMFSEPDYWENILQSQRKALTDRLTDQLLEVATDDDLSALNMWTGATFGNINKMMRYGVEVDPISAEAARRIEKVLGKLQIDEDIIVKRGTGTKNIFQQMGVSWGEDPFAYVGKTWPDNGFFATSPFSDGGFGGPGINNAELFVRVPKGTHAAYIELESHLETEKELLIQRGYSYRIVKAEYRESPIYPGEKDLKLWVELIEP